MREIFAVRDAASCRRALSEIEPLFGNPPAAGSEDELWLAAMIQEVEKYESEAFPLEEHPTPADCIRFMMEQNGLGPEDLVPDVGVLEEVREILEGKRELTLPMIRRLSARFGIPAECLAGI